MIYLDIFHVKNIVNHLIYHSTTTHRLALVAIHCKTMQRENRLFIHYNYTIITLMLVLWSFITLNFVVKTKLLF